MTVPSPDLPPGLAPGGSPVGDDLGLGLQLPGRGTVDATGRHRVHPVSPVVHGISALPVGVAVILAFGVGSVTKWGVLGLLAALGGLLLLGLAVAGWAYLEWRVTWFWFDDDGDFRVDSGVLVRQQRRLQLSRLQSVDVTQPLFARVFSLAEVVVEVAGSGDSRARLRYLTLQEARDLRSTILARAAGLRHDVGEAPERVIATVAPRDLALSLLMRSATAGLLLLSVVLLVITFVTEGWGGLTLALVTGGVPILVVVAEFMKYFGFTVSESPDGLRMRFGLARTETRTVPPGRVQAVELVEPLLWRRRSWVRVRLNIAGVGRDDGQGGREETLLIPVATRAVAEGLVQRVLPGLVLDQLPLHAAPERSRWRAPIQWQRIGVGWDDAVLVTRRGRITRRLSIVPHARTQSVRVTQGPWERLVSLASLHVDSTPGPVRITAPHLDAAFARDVADAQADRAGRGRGTDRSTHWARPDSAGGD